MRNSSRILVAAVTLAALASGMAHARQGGGDDRHYEGVADAATAAAGKAAADAAGISAATVAGVGVFLTPSSTASPAQSECVGTTNCQQGFPSTPPPAALPPAPPAPVGYLPTTSTEPQLTVPQN